MSRGQRYGRRADPAGNALAALDGARVPGGCEHCDAEQTVRPDGAGVWVVTVEHDPQCPVLLAKVRRGQDDPTKSTYSIEPIYSTELSD